MRSKKVVQFPESPHSAAQLPAARLATVVACDEDGNVWVACGERAPLPARLAMSVSLEALRTAVDDRQQAVLVFENGDPSLPLIIGLMQGRATKQIADASLVDQRANPVLDADADGKRVRVTAQEEIVLQCGPASITLRRNGRVVIRGTYVETHSEGTNRIKGGQVQIN